MKRWMPDREHIEPEMKGIYIPTNWCHVSDYENLEQRKYPAPTTLYK